MAKQKHVKAYASAEAAALALPPMTAEEIAAVARVLAQVERRRSQTAAPASSQAA